ncbi:MAG: mechanosensitive ion channel [Acidimicrobiales bacterium]
MAEWIAAAAVVVAAVVAASVLSRLTRRALGAPNRPEALRSSAASLASVVFSLALVIGLVVAVSVVAPDLLADIPTQLVTYLPRVVVAVVMIIGARAVATAAEIAVGRALARASNATQRRVVTAVRAGILGLAGLLAVGQLGINTTVINLAVAALFFGTAATLTLLIGLGGQEVANQAAAARTLKRSLRVGDELELHDVSGVVVAEHATAVEIQRADGAHVLVPAARLVQETVIVRRSAG